MCTWSIETVNSTWVHNPDPIWIKVWGEEFLFLVQNLWSSKKLCMLSAVVILVARREHLFFHIVYTANSRMSSGDIPLCNQDFNIHISHKAFVTPCFSFAGKPRNYYPCPMLIWLFRLLPFLAFPPTQSQPCCLVSKNKLCKVIQI